MTPGRGGGGRPVGGGGGSIIASEMKAWSEGRRRTMTSL